MEKIDNIYIRILAIRLNYMHLQEELSLIQNIYVKFKPFLSKNIDFFKEVKKYDNISLNINT